MRTSTRVGLYAGGLAVAFGGAYAVAAATVPDSAVDGWSQHDAHDTHAMPGMDPSTDAGMDMAHPAELQGVALSADGYVLADVSAPTTPGAAGTLSLRIDAPDGRPLTAYAEEHERDLHLIVVRSDGADFRHVHPTLDPSTGTWSLPWRWTAAGTYRVYADFTPTATGDSITLTRTVEVAGGYRPVVQAPSSVAHVDGFTVSLRGDLVAGQESHLTLSVTRQGEPVTDLQPYLGAFGHLVALRAGDLAYLHVHPHAAAPAPGDVGGPDISFMADVPTAGRYLLHLDFRVDGRVHSAPFVVDATS